MSYIAKTNVKFSKCNYVDFTYNLYYLLTFPLQVHFISQVFKTWFLNVN